MKRDSIRWNPSHNKRPKSNTCFSSRTGKALSVYTSKSAAQNAADYANQEYDNNLVPYQCNTCKKWHLSPQDRHTPNKVCPNCIGNNGQRKALYKTQSDAANRADILAKEQKVDLTVYKCPHNRGWHLTKGQ